MLSPETDLDGGRATTGGLTRANCDRVGRDKSLDAAFARTPSEEDACFFTACWTVEEEDDRDGPSVLGTAAVVIDLITLWGPFVAFVVSWMGCNGTGALRDRVFLGTFVVEAVFGRRTGPTVDSDFTMTGRIAGLAAGFAFGGIITGTLSFETVVTGALPCI